jgi:glycosyltransferase involved in cell wall biosynthesis
MIRILRIVGYLYPDAVGGIELHAFGMSRDQALMGHKVTVCTSRTGMSHGIEDRDGFEVRRFRPITRVLGNPVMPGLFLDLLRTKNDFDVIHAHSHLFSSTNFCALSRRLGSAPLVVTDHGLHSQRVPRWLQTAYTSTIAKWTLNSADCVVCYSAHEREALVSLGINPERVAVIHNGINTDLFKPGERGEGTNRVLWIGRFNPGKAVIDLVEGFRLLVKDHPTLKLVMIGRGSQKEVIENRIRKLGIAGMVTIRDFVPNTDLPGIYQASDVFVLPSVTEGLPRTVLEAMSCSVPVVCTALPSLVEAVGRGGILTPPHNPRALADSISAIISDKSFSRKMGECGRDIVTKNYSWEDTVKKTTHLYEELIDSR